VGPDEAWSYDFIQDRTASLGKRPPAIAAQRQRQIWTLREPSSRLFFHRSQPDAVTADASCTALTGAQTQSRKSCE
jgi:hypothetical protein